MNFFDQIVIDVIKLLRVQYESIRLSGSFVPQKLHVTINATHDIIHLQVFELGVGTHEGDDVQFVADGCVHFGYFTAFGLFMSKFFLAVPAPYVLFLFS